MAEPGHYTPDRKVTAGTVGGAVATLIAWTAQTWGGVDVPPGVEAAVATIVMALLAYFVRERPERSP